MNCLVLPLKRREEAGMAGMRNMEYRANAGVHKTLYYPLCHHPYHRHLFMTLC